MNFAVIVPIPVTVAVLPDMPTPPAVDHDENMYPDVGVVDTVYVPTGLVVLCPLLYAEPENFIVPPADGLVTNDILYMSCLNVTVIVPAPLNVAVLPDMLTPPEADHDENAYPREGFEDTVYDGCEYWSAIILML